MIYLVHLDKPRGEAHAVAIEAERLDDDGFWQDFGECDGTRYPMMEAAEVAADEWQQLFDAARRE